MCEHYVSSQKIAGLLRSYFFSSSSLWLPPGEWDQCVHEQKTWAACVIHGGDHGAVLPNMLAALRHHGPIGHLWATGPGHTRGEHHPLHPRQNEHGHRPSHLCLHEQTGEKGGGGLKLGSVPFIFHCQKVAAGGLPAHWGESSFQGGLR